MRFFSEDKKKEVERWAFSLDEVCSMTGLSKGHLRNENKRGKLQFVKSGRRTLVTAEELRRYLAEQSRHSGGVSATGEKGKEL